VNNVCGQPALYSSSDVTVAKDLSIVKADPDATTTWKSDSCVSGAQVLTILDTGMQCNDNPVCFKSNVTRSLWSIGTSNSLTQCSCQNTNPNCGCGATSETCIYCPPATPNCCGANCIATTASSPCFVQYTTWNDGNGDFSLYLTVDDSCGGGIFFATSGTLTVANSNVALNGVYTLLTLTKCKDYFGYDNPCCPFGSTYSSCCACLFFNDNMVYSDGALTADGVIFQNGNSYINVFSENMYDYTDSVSVGFCGSTESKNVFFNFNNCGAQKSSSQGKHLNQTFMDPRFWKKERRTFIPRTAPQTRK